MPFTIFQKGAHRIPTLRLYKSLLKLSSSLEADLASRIQNKVRREFRKNKVWSPRIVKHNLIRAFKVHETIERSIDGDRAALNSLFQSFPQPKKSSSKPLLPPVVLPPRPPPHHDGQNVYKAPGIRYGVYTLPQMVYPILKIPFHKNIEFNKKIELLRQYGEAYKFYPLMLYHAKLEESFLSRLAIMERKNWGYDREAGSREMAGMVKLIGKLIADLMVKEDIRVENEIKDWVKLHPNVTFRPYGVRMTRSRRRELMTWKKDVKEIKRTRGHAKKRIKFMRRWKERWGNEPKSVMYINPQQRKAKRAAKKLRRRKMGKLLLWQ